MTRAYALVVGPATVAGVSTASETALLMLAIMLAFVLAFGGVFILKR